MTTTLAICLAFALGALGATWRLERRLQRARALEALTPTYQLDSLVRRTRRQMNDAAGQSWRNILE